MTGAPLPVVGVLHPGSMGAAIAAQAVEAGATVLWCSAGRSEASKARAHAAGLVEVTTLDELVERCGVVLSICPPAYAEDVAEAVASLRFAGIFVECNAISPLRVTRIAARLGLNGTAKAVVDGAVVGSPPRGTKTTRLYLAGPMRAVRVVEDLFAGTAVHVKPLLADHYGQASALKLAYSAYQKASRALAAVAYGLAEAHGVGDELLDVAAGRGSSYLSEVDYIPKTAARAWRWAPEMLEVADALRAKGLPPEQALAAAEVMARWDADKDQRLTVGEALQHLRRSGSESRSDRAADERRPCGE